MINLQSARLRPWRQLASGCLALIAAAAAFPATTQSDGDAAVLERRVKATFLYKFLSYVEWPESSLPKPNSPFTIAVVGDDALAAELAEFAAGRSTEGRSVVVRKVNDPGEAASAHILFVARTENARLSQLVKTTQAKPVLIVTESDGALASGSMINFVVSGGRVRFEVSVDAADKRQLKLSSRLLTVALNVRVGTP
jgi:hypothetical protein